MRHKVHTPIATAITSTLAPVLSPTQSPALNLTASKPISLLLATLGASVVLIALATSAAALLQTPRAIFVAMFEVSVLAAGAVTIMLGLGKISTGRALALLCIAGSLAAATVFGYLAVNGELAGRNLKWWAIARLAVAGLLIALAAAEVLLRDPRECLKRFAIGTALLLPAAAALAALASASVRARLDGLDALPQVLLALVGFFLILAFVCAGGHYLITAFIRGVEVAETQEDRAA